MRMAGPVIALVSAILGGCASTALPSTPLHRAAASQPVRYSAKTFYDTISYGLPSTTGRAFSADGKWILISSDSSGVFNAYKLPVAGGDPVAVTHSADNATYPVSFFPRDDRVLFTADQGGDELSHIFVRASDGTVRDLTPGKEVKAQFLGWSNNGDTFWIMTNERDPKTFDIYSYDTASYERRLVYQNQDYRVNGISSDGRYVAFRKDLSTSDSNLYLADLKGAATPQLITPHQGQISHAIYGFTPDSKSLIYATNEVGEFRQAWAYDLAGSGRRPVIRADWDVASVAYSPSGRYRVSALNADSSTRLTIEDTRAARVIRLAGISDGDIQSVHFNRAEAKVAFTLSTDVSPADIFVAELATGQAKRLTTALNPAVDVTKLGRASIARFRSYDGLEIPGILYRPVEASAANPVPVLAWTHGGPAGQSRREYTPEIQHLVNNGYAVYAINHRGSVGYGKTFVQADDRKHGDVDLKDVIASKAFLQSLDWISKDKIGIVGGSYGGFMVAAALAFHPQAFDAGINMFGVTNWFRLLETLPPWAASLREAMYNEMGDPKRDAERLRRISPLFHAKNIQKPLLVVQGKNDPRVLQVESDELVAAVRANNVPVEYLLFPDEGHGFARKANRIAASEAYLKFLDKYVRGGN
jgi:dipeptidyl aminopeptidase/acylaminoacyl peptidase